MAAILVIGIVLLGLWLAGLVTSFTLGGFIHLALAIGLILVVVWAVTRYRARKAWNLTDKPFRRLLM